MTRRFLIAGACIVAACADPLGLHPALTQPDADGRIAFAIVDGSPDVPRDHFMLQQARMEGDTLILDIRFGGGCTTHEFLLVGNNVRLKSDPPQTNVVLAHDANGDACEALLSRSLRADVSPLRDAYRRNGSQHGTIILNVAGASVPYRF